MIVVSKRPITTKRGKSGLLGTYDIIKPTLGKYDIFGNFIEGTFKHNPSNW